MKKWTLRFGWMGLGIAALYAVSAMAGAVSGGSLDPPGPPGSTMRSLDELPPIWDQLLTTTGADPCNTPRFVCVMNGEAVRDNETGLVWQRTPEISDVNWYEALENCRWVDAGGRFGWRLPMQAEVSSLYPLSAGHPFPSPFGGFWTSDPSDRGAQFAVYQGLPAGLGNVLRTDVAAQAWCVRGGGAALLNAAGEPPPPWSTRRSAGTGQGSCTSDRYGCVLEFSQGVLDRDTALVWQRAPSAGLTDWIGAINACMVATDGGVTGWRLPTAAELRSVTLSANDPFQVTITGTYWTATTGFAATTGAYVVDFADLGTPNVNAKASATSKHWCVRGPGQMADGM